MFNDLVTPSELLLLRAPEVAPSARLLDSFKLVGSEQKVSTQGLGTILLAAAFLACESSGAIRLEIQKKKAMLGLRQVDQLYVLPTGSGGNFPAGSYEAVIVQTVQSLSARKPCEPWQVIHAMIGYDTADPWGAAVRLVYKGLSQPQRNLVTVVEEKKLKIFTVAHFEMPAETLRQAAGANLADAKNLQLACKTQRPQIWSMLEAQIKKGVEARRESDSGDMN